MKHQIHLDYTIPVGDLAPYFDALKEGKALASKCDACGKTAFPARLRCADCGNDQVGWHALSGRAKVVFRSDGMGGSFALVQFDGADTQSTVAIANPEITTDFGALMAPPNDGSGLWLEMIQDDTRNEDVR